ncbi:Bifunctional transcriptional activator/DNA repair enzyme AdaA [compost metagenome]
MKYKKTASASLTVFHLIDVNISILLPDHTLLLAHERDHLPDFFLKLQQEDFVLLSRQALISAGECCAYTNELGLSYLARLVELEGEEAAIWIAGPYLKQMPDLNRLEGLLPESHKRDEMKDFLSALKLLGKSKMQSMVNLLSLSEALDQAPYLDMNTQSEAAAERNRKDLQHILRQPDEQETKMIELRYEYEKEMMHAVEKGDKLKLKNLNIEVNQVFDFSERFPNQPIRAMKNMLIIFNTVLRIAAQRGNVHPFFLHYISEKFSKKIERSDNIHTLNSLNEVMWNEYCDLVKNRSVTGYSLLVTRAAQHIKINFSKPLRLAELAEYCLVHPSHLSRQFKKETGMTLTEYQNRMRIDEAKLLLREGRDSIDRIAGYVGYDDAGYFTRMFKRLEGLTPTRFRGTQGKEKERLSDK